MLTFPSVVKPPRAVGPFDRGAPFYLFDPSSVIAIFPMLNHYQTGKEPQPYCLLTLNTGLQLEAFTPAEVAAETIREAIEQA